MASESDDELDLNVKLLLGQNVEVLSTEEGVHGSWHRGMVLDMKPLQRIVMYTYLFNNDQTNLVESVPVSRAIDGILPEQPSPQISKRNNIRPFPGACRLPLQPAEATYGMCVDACVANAHWEGILLNDTNGRTAQSIQRIVFFPDLGIEESVPLENLSLSTDWDEITGEWTPRGRWKFLEALEANRASLCMAVHQLWHIARSQPYFVTAIGAWTCGTRDEWYSLVCMMHQLNCLTTATSVQSGAFSESVFDFVEAYKNKSSSRAGALSKTLKEKSDMARSHLKSVGWQFMETSGGAKYYVSTDGTRYDSFIKACEGYLSGKAGPPRQENATRSVIAGGMSENKATRELHLQKHTWNPIKLIPEYSSQLARGGKYGSIESDTVRKHLLHLGWIVEYKIDTNRPMTRYRYHSPGGKTYYSLRLVFADFVSVFHSEKDGYMQLTDDESKPDQLMFNGGDKSGSNGGDPNLETPEVNGENRVLAQLVLIDNILPENLKEQLEYMQINCSKPGSNKLTGNGENQSSPNKDYSHLPQPAGNEGNQLGLNGEEGSCFARDSVSNDIQPEGALESIKEYIKCIENRIRSNLKGFTSPSDVRSNAKRHLLSAGWTECLISLKSNRPRLLYQSPSGKCFGSLLQACKAYLMEAFPASRDATSIMQERNIPGETSGLSTTKRRHHTFYSQGAILASEQGRSKRRKSRDLANLTKAKEKFSKSKGNSNSYCKTESNSPSSPLKRPKTALSLLIDKNVVMPRTRVSYRYRHFTKDGVITCNAIRCICCNNTFSATNFEVHAGGASSGRPLSNIYLRDGRSLLQCLVEAMEMRKLGTQLGSCFNASDDNGDSDVICSACHHGDSLVKCCNCPSAFHPSCVGLKETPECYWCPLCCCRVCKSGVDKAMVVSCQQCEGKFHIRCVTEGSQGLGLTEPWFCSSQCCEVAMKLDSLIGKRIPTSEDGLTWSILKFSMRAPDRTTNWGPEILAEQHSKLCLAAEVLNECFMPMIEPRTKSDLISDMIFNRESDLSRINFKRFYTIILEKGDEVVAVATLRVHGEKLAELPLVGTCIHYRRQGLCRRLITEIEKVLSEVKVEKIILPSIQQQLEMWTGSFNFTVIDKEGLLELIKYNVLTFPNSTLCEKKLL